MISFIALLGSSIPFTVLILSLVNVIPLQALTGINPLLLIPITLGVPIGIIFFGAIFPQMKASTRMSELEIEIPYASMYISVMVSGGLSPFESFLRMRKMDLLPKMRQEIDRIETIVMSTGVDPVTAMERAAKVVEIKDYKELLLGYASSVRTGGDTLHYLYNQTQTMFRKLTISVKSKGETAAMLMEAYTIIGILGVLGIFLVFVVGMSLPTAGVSISPYQFFLFSLLFFITNPFFNSGFTRFGFFAGFLLHKSFGKQPVKFFKCNLLIFQLRSFATCCYNQLSLFCKSIFVLGFNELFFQVRQNF